MLETREICSDEVKGKSGRVLQSRLTGFDCSLATQVCFFWWGRWVCFYFGAKEFHAEMGKRGRKKRKKKLPWLIFLVQMPTHKKKSLSKRN